MNLFNRQKRIVQLISENVTSVIGLSTLTRYRIWGVNLCTLLKHSL
uniref:Uncharacterized protein n=1 Tax=Arundo donax TaxID=35708 RepID=A0A0A9QL71_ARUDO